MPPKLVRKSKSATTPLSVVPEENTLNNNNTTSESYNYEMLNPRYATEGTITDSDTQATTVSAGDSRSASSASDSRVGTYIEEPWTIIGSYFEGKHLDQLVRHQIESYNDMVNVQLKRTVDMFNPVRIASEQDYNRTTHNYRLEVEITFDNLYLSRPQIHENTGATKVLFPQEARLRNFTYASMMTVDMSVKYIVREAAVAVAAVAATLLQAM